MKIKLRVKIKPGIRLPLTIRVNDCYQGTYGFRAHVDPIENVIWEAAGFMEKLLEWSGQSLTKAEAIGKLLLRIIELKKEEQKCE